MEEVSPRSASTTAFHAVVSPSHSSASARSVTSKETTASPAVTASVGYVESARTASRHVVHFIKDRDLCVYIMTFAFVLLFFAYPIQGVQVALHSTAGLRGPISGCPSLCCPRSPYRRVFPLCSCPSCSVPASDHPLPVDGLVHSADSVRLLRHHLAVRDAHHRPGRPGVLHAPGSADLRALDRLGVQRQQRPRAGRGSGLWMGRGTGQQSTRSALPRLLHRT